MELAKPGVIHGLVSCRVFKYLIVLYGTCLSKRLFTILRKWARASFGLEVRQKPSQLTLTRSALNLSLSKYL